MTGQELPGTDISSTGKTTTGDGQAPQTTLTVNGAAAPLSVQGGSGGSKSGACYPRDGA